MVLIWDGNSEIGVLMESDIGSLICLSRLFISKAIANLKIIFIYLLFVSIFKCVPSRERNVL